jgi:hypothetical protein
MKRYLNILILVCLLAVTAGCGGNAAGAQGELPVLEKGMSGLQGRLTGAGGLWPGRETTLWAAPYYAEGSGGFYVLEPNIHPHAVVDGGGRFILSQVVPGSYVLVAGPSPEEAVLLVDGDGQTVIVTLQPDVWLDMGEVEVGG